MKRWVWKIFIGIYHPTEFGDDLTLTNVTSIPEDDLEAETFYSQFENEFEDDDDSDDSGGSDGTGEDNDEHNALINQLQAALELDTQETIIEDTVEERFSQTLRQQRIAALRQYPFLNSGTF